MIKKRLPAILFALPLVAGALGFTAPAQAERDTGGPPSTMAAPPLQMPFFCGQTWKATTHDGQLPDQNSIDLYYPGGLAEGKQVVAATNGTVIEVKLLTNGIEQFGKLVRVDHGGGVETRYAHVETNLSAGASLVRGQRIGTVGKYGIMTPHLQYTQLLAGSTVRISFNSTLINVHKNAPQNPPGTYPTQNLTSNNCGTNCVVTQPTAKSGAVNCAAGAGYRAVVECEILANGQLFQNTGAQVAATMTSTATCGNHALVGSSFKLS